MGKTFNVPYFNFLERKDFDDKVKAFEKAFEQGFETEQELNQAKNEQPTPREYVEKILGYRGMEVLQNAESQFPNESKIIIENLL